MSQSPEPSLRNYKNQFATSMQTPTEPRSTKQHCIKKLSPHQIQGRIKSVADTRSMVWAQCHGQNAPKPKPADVIKTGGWLGFNGNFNTDLVTSRHIKSGTQTSDVVM